jgi:hypothetical protein
MKSCKICGGKFDALAEPLVELCPNCARHARADAAPAPAPAPTDAPPLPAPGKVDTTQLAIDVLIAAGLYAGVNCYFKKVRDVLDAALDPAPAPAPAPVALKPGDKVAPPDAEAAATSPTESLVRPASESPYLRFVQDMARCHTALHQMALAPDSELHPAER